MSNKIGDKIGVLIYGPVPCIIIMVWESPHVVTWDYYWYESESIELKQTDGDRMLIGQQMQEDIERDGLEYIIPEVLDAIFLRDVAQEMISNRQYKVFYCDRM